RQIASRFGDPEIDAVYDRPSHRHCMKREGPGFESRSLQPGVRCEPGTATTFSFLVGAGLLPYVVEDLVAGLARNAERATDLAHRSAVQQPSDEPQALVHHRTLLPRHPRSPEKGKGVTHVSGTICHLCLGPLIVTRGADT